MRQLLLIGVLLVAGCGQENISQKEISQKEKEVLKENRPGWRQLRKGMPEDKVRALLGEPVKIDNEEDVSCWYYLPRGQPLRRVDKDTWFFPRGAVLFSKKGGAAPALTSWRDP